MSNIGFLGGKELDGCEIGVGGRGHRITFCPF